MLRGILSRLSGRATRPGVRRAPRTTGPATAGTTANRDIATGARSLLRGLSRKRRI
jgi:hypothetical protein